MPQFPARRSGRDVATADPYREFEDIYDRMGQLVNAVLMGGPYLRVTDVPWAPLADITETDDAYVIEAELPGVTKDNIKVEVNDREVVISGEIPQQDEDGGEKGRRRRRGRRTGRFELRSVLPGDINPDAITANLSDGVLTVRVLKAEAAKPRHVEITG